MMKNVLQNPMISVLSIADTQKKKNYLKESLGILHTLFSPITSQTKTFSNTLEILLRKENFGIKSPVILMHVPSIDVPSFLRENKEQFVSPLIFGTDYEWFSQQRKEIFTYCLNDTIVCVDTLYEERGAYVIDLHEFLSEVRSRKGSITFALHKKSLISH